MAVVAAYHRRRGWLAWHIATLTRTDGDHYPTLDELTGLRARKVEIDPAEMASRLRLWAAALGARDEAESAEVEGHQGT